MTATLFNAELHGATVDPNDAFDVLAPGQFRSVQEPLHGRQHVGLCPGGPADRFSVVTGNIMLGNPDFAPALEIVTPPTLRFRRDSLFVLTGARCANLRLVRSSMGQPWPTEVEPNRVEFAQRGDRLSFGDKEYGYRVYLCHAPCGGPETEARRARIGRSRGAYRNITRWCDPEGRIRVTEGPEFAAWRNPEIVLDQVATTAREPGGTGLPLTPLSGERPRLDGRRPLYGALNDGTVQALPNGLLALLRDRPTFAAFPRILNVIDPDVDLLAQCGPNQVVRFHKVSLAEALAAHRKRQADLDAFRKKWSA